MYDGTATLYALKTQVADEYGNMTNTYDEREVFVQPRGVYQSEFYNASQLGLHPSVTLFIANREDYQDEKLLKYNGKDYRVVRVDWNAQRDGISLICEERVNNG